MQFRDILINDDEKLCYIKGEIVDLTKSEYKLLLFFLNNRNKVFSREEFLEAAWTKKVSKRAVDTTITRLRKKLGEYGKHIRTRLGFGYYFKEDV